jgi:hypothetical protein
MIYEIRLQGHLDQSRSQWFDGMALSYDAQGHTILLGPVTDQAALYGLLDKVRDLGLPLISVNQIEVPSVGL